MKYAVHFFTLHRIELVDASDPTIAVCKAMERPAIKKLLKQANEVGFSITTEAEELNETEELREEAERNMPSTS